MVEYVGQWCVEYELCIVQVFGFGFEVVYQYVVEVVVVQVGIGYQIVDIYEWIVDEVFLLLIFCQCNWYVIVLDGDEVIVVFYLLVLVCGQFVGVGKMWLQLMYDGKVCM